jgi:LysR family transcriptional regulator of gallate degradation
MQTLSQSIERQLRHLHVFAAVADAESIVGAAERLFKAPSAVTRSVLELERCLGLTLFERMPRGMLLNAYGEAALLRARAVHAEIQLAAAALLRARGRASAASQAAVSSMLFDGRKLRLLVQLAELRNISAAATRLQMTQAGASMALARMEAGLGLKLFRRRMQGMIATEAADQLVLHARRVFSELRHLTSDLSAISGNLTGSVVVGTTPLGRIEVFSEAIAAVVTRCPGIRVLTIESPYEQLVGSLHSGDIDVVIGVLRPGQQNHGLITQALLTDRMGVVARAGHPFAGRGPLQLADLMQERWILPSQGRRPLVDACFERRCLTPPVPAVETGDATMLRQLLLASDMLAVTSTFQLRADVRAGLLCQLPLTLDETVREVGISTRDGARLSMAARAVIDAIVQRSRMQQPTET